MEGYDYSQAGTYFVTICCGNRECRFGKIENNEMVLNEYGIIAYNEWLQLSQRFINFELDVFPIMPNHVHAIIVIVDVGAGPKMREPQKIWWEQAPPPTVGGIVGAYKSLVTNGCLSIYKSKNETMGKLWQRNYYEQIIRNEQSYQRISEYIINNPKNWPGDKLNR